MRKAFNESIPGLSWQVVVLAHLIRSEARSALKHRLGQEELGALVGTEVFADVDGTQVARPVADILE